MLFHTFPFLLFFLTVYFLYLFLPLRGQNLLLLAASYVFYSAWDWRFAVLLLISTAVDYLSAIQMEDSRGLRRFFLGLSLFTNLGILGFFKYFNFFSASLADLLACFHFQSHPVFLKVILPAGVSFYTFQSISYSVDVYRGKWRAVRRFPDFALYVSFFPQLLAGPISRASQLLPQITRPRKISFEGFQSGCLLFFLGLFQKIYVADHLSGIVHSIFDRAGPWTAAEAALGAAAFSFQIYGDFAGYSNMARGLARMMAFDLPVNFKQPFFSAGPKEFWQRWHISLSEWIRDYLYIPLGGNQGSRVRQAGVLIITLTLAGLWHGAAWTFVLWGLYHGLLLVLYRGVGVLFPSRPVPEGLLARALFFALTAYGFLIFRAHSLSQVLEMTRSLFSLTAGSGFALIKPLFFILLPLFVLEIFEKAKGVPEALTRLPLAFRWTIYIALFHLMLYSGNANPKQFIYFQF